LLTHAHLDHVFGLTFVLDFLATTPLKHIHVYAEAEKIAAIQQHLFHPLLFPVVPPFHWHALEDLGTTFRVDNTEVTWFPLEHPGGSVGFKLDWQSTSLAYVTDTTCSLNSGYWNVIQGVDWLIHECNFSDDYKELAVKTGHSWTSEVLEAAYKHKIARLLLGHFNPLTDSSDPIGIDHATSRNLRKTPSQIMMATDGLTIDLERL
jgi:ribonuclease Z